MATKEKEQFVAGGTNLYECLRIICTRGEGWPVLPYGLTSLSTVTCDDNDSDSETEDDDVFNTRPRIFQTLEKITHLDSALRSLMAEYFTDPDTSLTRPLRVTRRRLSALNLEYNLLKKVTAFESLHKIARREWNNPRTLRSPQSVFGKIGKLPTRIIGTSSSDSVVPPFRSSCF